MIPRKRVNIKIPEIGNLTVIELSGKDFVEITEQATDEGGMDRGKFLSLALLKSVYDGDKPFFLNVEEVEELPASLYTKLITEVVNLNGFDSPKN